MACSLDQYYFNDYYLSYFRTFVVCFINRIKIQIENIRFNIANTDKINQITTNDFTLLF